MKNTVSLECATYKKKKREFGLYTQAMMLSFHVRTIKVKN